METKICNGCKIEQNIDQFKCKFRVNSKGFKNCHECRKGWRYYMNKRNDEKRKLMTDYRRIDKPRQKYVRKSRRTTTKQCFACIWLYSPEWECIHDNEERYVVFSEDRRNKIQKFNDYDDAREFFMKYRGKRNGPKRANKVLPRKAKVKPIPKEKFTVKFTI